MIQHASIAAASVLLATLASAGEDDWPSFRGERAHGVAEGWETPVEWDVPAKENVAWRTEVPGLAHSSPIVWKDKVFVTTAVRQDADAELSSLYGSPGYGAGESVTDEGPHAFMVFCLDRDSGEILWERTAHTGVPKVKRHPKSSHANSTPACDAKRVVAFFGSEGLYAYDHDGKLLWKRDFGVLDCGAPDLGNHPQLAERDPKDFQWGFASSPVLYGDTVVVQCDVQGQSFVAALDADTGEERWRTERDENPTWCTPTVHERGDGMQVLLNGYKHIGAYDLATGKELWKLEGGGDVPVPTPVVEHDLVFFTSAHGRLAPLYAVRVDAEGTLSSNENECEGMQWYNSRSGVYMQTLLVYGLELYACSDGGVLGCYDALTGKRIYRERLGDGKTGFSASGVAADGKLYYTAESGEVHVVAAGTTFESLAVNDLGETCLATPAVSRGRLFFRTTGHVVAVGESD